MADVADTSQRAAARSSLALSMSRWGCQGDPQVYQWEHMLTAIERTLKTESTRYLGDAFMLIAGLLKSSKPKDTSDCNWICTFPLSRDDPLHHNRVYFQETESLALFEPENNRGLGLEIASTLLEARIRSVGQMACSGAHGPRWMTFKEAQACYRHLPDKAEAEWAKTVEALNEGGLSGTFPEREVQGIWGQRKLCSVNGEVQLSSAREQKTRLDVKALDELHTAIRESVDRRKKGLPTESSADWDWEGAIRRAFPDTVEPVAEEWASGGVDIVADASGGRLFFESDEHTRFSGGEASWMTSEQVDQHGFLVDWQARAEEMRRGFSFDAEGYLCHSSCGRIAEEDLGNLEPAVQMVARARLALGEVPVFEGDGNKRRETHVQLRAQYLMWAKITAWAARIGATKVYTLDGSRRMVPTGEGGWMPICTRAAVDHEGNTFGGRFMGEAGVAEDNYHAELAAQLDALSEATRKPGERVIIIFDATSPVLAMLKFGRLGARARGDRLAAELLEHFERLRRRCAALVLLWQTSHVGEPVNEYADITCDKFGIEDVCPIQRGEVQFASVTFPGHIRSAQEFAIKGMSALVASRLRRRVQQTILREPDEHVALFRLSEEAAAICEAVGARRCQYVDQPYPGRRASLLIGTEPCPFGCLRQERCWRELHPAAAATRTKLCLPALADYLDQQIGGLSGDTVGLSERMEARLRADEVTHVHAVQAKSGRWFIRDAYAPSWWHFQFECMGTGVVSARKHYALQAVKARSCLLKLIGPDAAGRGQGHGQLNDLIVLLHQGLGGWEAEDGAAGSAANQMYIKERAQRGERDGWVRAAAGVLDRTGNQADNSSKFRMAITDMVVAGCALQRVGKEQCRKQANAFSNQLRNLNLLSAVVREWAVVQRAAGVRRTADLRDIRLAAWFVRRHGALDGYGRRKLVTATSKMIQDVEEPVGGNDPAEWLLMRIWLAWRLVLARGQGRRGRVVLHGGGAEPLRELLWLAATGQGQDFSQQPETEHHLQARAQAAWRKWLRAGGGAAYTAFLRKRERTRRIAVINAQREGMRRWARIADGTKWHILTEKETEERIELIHDKLSDALGKSQNLTRLEWKEMNVRGLRVGHFVRDRGGFFYAPGEVASNNTISGDAFTDQREHLEIEIEPRRGPGRNETRRKMVLKERRERRRRIVMRDVRDGIEPDDAGRWAIQRIVQVERPSTSRRGRPLRALVQWVGEDEDGNPWQDSWVGVTMLTADQRAEARRLEKARYASEDAGKQARKEIVARRRTKPQEEDKKQWEVRLRNRKRALESVDMG